VSKAFFTTAGSIEHDTGSAVSGGSFSISTPASTKIKASGNFVYTGPTIAVSFSGGNMAGMVPGSVAGAGTIAPTTSKNYEVPSLGILRDGDSGTLVGTGTPVGGGPPVPVSIPCHCHDTQTKVVGE
jgi:hypothetical protein